MTFLDRLMGGPVVSTHVAEGGGRTSLTAAAVAPVQVGIQSPMSEPDTLSAVVWADLTGRDAAILDRAAAMAIPAMARQRHLICGVGARCPLRLVDTTTYTPGTPPPIVADQPAWLTQGSGSLSAYHRMLWTLDDLIFHPFAVWEVEREGDRPDGDIVWADRVPTERWEVERDTDRLLIDGRPVEEHQVLILPGPHEGVLQFGAKSLTRTIDNLDAAARAAKMPNAWLEIHYSGDEPLTPEQKAEVRADWAAARRGENAGVALTNKWTEIKEHGTHEAQLLIEGRNADAVDVSRLVSSPAAMADATSAGASLTYETTSGRNVQFLDYGASLYMDAIGARLSMDDVCQPGQGVAFDVSRLTVVQPTETGGTDRPQE